MTVRESGKSGYREAKIVQTALAIALLLNAPVRIENLASIRMDRHILKIGPNTLHLRFPKQEVKNRVDLEFVLTDSVTALLMEYLDKWHPILRSGSTPYLFPGRQVTEHKGNGALSGQIRDLVFSHTRLNLSAHRFRHAVGKIWLIHNPGMYEVVRLLLGHKSVDTTIRFYAGDEAIANSKLYNQTILKIEEDL